MKFLNRLERRTGVGLSEEELENILRNRNSGDNKKQLPYAEIINELLSNPNSFKYPTSAISDEEKIPHLTSFEKEFLEKRLEGSTLESVALEKGISRDKITQVEAKIFAKIRILRKS